MHGLAKVYTKTYQYQVAGSDHVVLRGSWRFSSVLKFKNPFHFFPFFRSDRAEAGVKSPATLAANLADVLVGAGGVSMLTVDFLRREGVVRTITFTAAGVDLGVGKVAREGVK